MEALALIQRYADSRSRTYPVDETVPIEGVIQEHWANVVFEKDADGQQCVNRISYELCVLEGLRERLRCKEIWVAGANRYRNPEKDLPADFDTARSQYYLALRLPQRVFKKVSPGQCGSRQCQSEFRRSEPDIRSPY
jgi:hypothetical protein